MLSRGAESLYWLSRYMERAENTARFMDVNFHLLLDLNVPEREASRYWEPLIAATDDRERFSALHTEFNEDTVTDFLVFNEQNPNSVISCISNARENARGVIETISSEMWEQINSLYHFVKNTRRDLIESEPYDFYRQLKNASHLFQGITDSTFSRAEGWDFIQTGRYLERADNTSRLIDVKYHSLVKGDKTNAEEVDAIQWMALLKSVSALEAYRKTFHGKIDPQTVAKYLCLDRFFPRSIYFCVSSLQESLWHISGSRRREFANEADRQVGKLEAELNYTTIEDIYQKGLHTWLDNLQKSLLIIGQQLYGTYFAYRVPGAEEAALRRKPGNSGRAVWSPTDYTQQQQQQQ